MANLPKLDYRSLSKLPTGKRRKLGYKTYAENRGEMVVIYHHNNAIAGVHKNRLELDNCGWDSNTTRDRLDQIVYDNFGYDLVRVVKHDYAMKLHIRNSKVHIPFRQAVVHKAGEVNIIR